LSSDCCANDGVAPKQIVMTNITANRKPQSRLIEIPFPKIENNLNRLYVLRNRFDWKRPASHYAREGDFTKGNIRKIQCLSVLFCALPSCLGAIIGDASSLFVSTVEPPFLQHATIANRIFTLRVA
jgi:hypothetical protein